MDRMIDFQAEFAAWLQQYRKQLIEMSNDEVDDVADRLYDQWLHERQQAFGGVEPAHYFDAFSADELVSALLSYGAAEWALPDSLCDKLEDERANTKPLLISALSGQLTVRQEGDILERLGEMGAEEIIPFCVSRVLEHTGDRAEQAAQALIPFGALGAQPCLQALQTQDWPTETTDRLADIVCACSPPLPGAAEQMRNLFVDRPEARAFYAHCLERTEDEAAVPLLKAALEQQGLGYYEFLALRDSYEALTGEILPDREFWEDADYLVVEHAGEEERPHE
ncbi:MAG: hypothetical protein IJP30_04675 [Clostridia bacterium]|nr:hypothetical protein [Clostridia bacterium]